MKNKIKKSFDIILSNGSYAFLPIINTNLFTAPDSLSGLNKLLYSVLILTSIFLYSIINICGYFGFLYISKYTNLETKYPKIKPILKYFETISIFWLVVEIIFVVSILITIIILTLHLLSIANES